MKKITVILLALIMSISFVACSSKSDDTVTEEPTTETTTQLVEKTTALPTDDEEKGKKLSARISEILSMEGADFGGDLSTGGFSYELTDASPEEVYKNEASDEIKAQSEEKAKALVDGIREFYNDEITFVSSETRVVGTGDNGIDSALYEITYNNSQNQSLVIIADSRGEIVIVKCNFTW